MHFSNFRVFYPRISQKKGMENHHTFLSDGWSNGGDLPISIEESIHEFFGLLFILGNPITAFLARSIDNWMMDFLTGHVLGNKNSAMLQQGTPSCDASLTHLDSNSGSVSKPF